MKQEGKRKGGARKIGRSKRKGLDTALSAYVRGKITFETYAKRKGISIQKVKS